MKGLRRKIILSAFIVLLTVVMAVFCSFLGNNGAKKIGNAEESLSIENNYAVEYSDTSDNDSDLGNSGSKSSGLWESIKSGFRTTFIDSENSKALLDGLLMTLFLIVVTLVLGFIIGGLLFLLRYYCENVFTKIMTKFIYWFSLVPVSTWLLICYYLIFPAHDKSGYLIGVFGLSISFSFNVFKCFIGALESVPKEQIETAIAMGYNKRTALKRIILPQLFPSFLSLVENEVVYHIRDTSIVGYIAIQDIQAVADAISRETAEPFFPIILTAVVYTTLCALLTFLIRLLRKKLFPEVASAKRIKTRINKGVKK